MKYPLKALVLTVFCLLSLNQAAQAELVTFNLQAGSNLALSGNSNVGAPVNGSFPYAPQGLNSLIAAYLGTITVDVNNSLAPTSIVFQSAVLDASVNGQWLPGNVSTGSGGGTASDADYGMAVAALGANARLRDIVFNLSAPSISISGGSFSVATQTLAYTSGQFDVYSAGLGDGANISLSNPLTSVISGLNSSASQGTYSVVGNIATITIPVTVSINYNIPGTPTVDGTNTYTGQFIGVASVPEPSSLGLLSIFGCGALARSRKRTLPR